MSTAWPAASVRLDWDAGSRTYLVTTDGRPDVDADGARHAAATVVVQQVPTHLSDNRDVNGAQTPVVDLVGQGPAVVLRDGQQWTGEWSRPQASAPTAYTASGQPVAMAAGPVWVLLVPDGQAVTVPDRPSAPPWLDRTEPVPPPHEPTGRNGRTAHRVRCRRVGR